MVCDLISRVCDVGVSLSIQSEDAQHASQILNAHPTTTTHVSLLLLRGVLIPVFWSSNMILMCGGGSCSCFSQSRALVLDFPNRILVLLTKRGSCAFAIRSSDTWFIILITPAGDVRGYRPGAVARSIVMWSFLNRAAGCLKWITMRLALLYSPLRMGIHLLSLGFLPIQSSSHLDLVRWSIESLSGTFTPCGISSTIARIGGLRTGYYRLVSCAAYPF